MSVDISVVICVYNGAETLADCLCAVRAQNFPADRYELIVVDDGSTDGSGEIAKSFDARVQIGPHRGLASARNIGWRMAQGEWVAFTDDDCGPTRNWLASYWRAVHPTQSNERVLGAAGRIVGFPSHLDVPRFVELRGGFNTDRHLEHPMFPYAPMGNAMYRREALEAVNGLDERYRTYEACNLHTRLRQEYGGQFYYEPRALVLHQHPTTWQTFYYQQQGYGRGTAQFLLQYRKQVPWSLRQELGAWANIAALSTNAPRADALAESNDEQTLMCYGDFVKQLAQRIGFAQTYWSQAERAQW